MRTIAACLIIVFGQAASALASWASRGRRLRAEAALRENDERAQARLQAARLENQTLATRLIAAQEAERHRIARDLHDDLSQKLALLNIEIERLPQTATDHRRLEAVTRCLSEFVAEIARDVHDLSHELHPSKLEIIGLVAALHGLCGDISRRFGVMVEFNHAGRLAGLDSSVALHVYRIAQEALHNVVKHSGAREARVDLIGASDVLELRVADHGRGFAADRQRSEGLGIVSMRERVRLLGGRFVIHSAVGTGTRLGVRVPIDQRHSYAA